MHERQPFMAAIIKKGAIRRLGMKGRADSGKDGHNHQNGEYHGADAVACGYRAAKCTFKQTLFHDVLLEFVAISPTVSTCRNPLKTINPHAPTLSELTYKYKY